LGRSHPPSRLGSFPLRPFPLSQFPLGPFPTTLAVRRIPASAQSGFKGFPLRPRSGQCACATAARRSGSTSTTSSRPPGSGGYSRVRVLTVLTTTPSRPPGSRRYSQHSRRYRRLVSRPHRHRDCAAATRHVATVPRRSGPSLWFLWQSTPGGAQSA
jgi:hypothetical protein